MKILKHVFITPFMDVNDRVYKIWVDWEVHPSVGLFWSDSFSLYSFEDYTVVD